MYVVRNLFLLNVVLKIQLNIMPVGIIVIYNMKYIVRFRIVLFQKEAIQIIL